MDLDRHRGINDRGASLGVGGESKALWLIVLVGSMLLGFAVVGSLLYLLIPRPRLRRLPALR